MIDEWLKLAQLGLRSYLPCSDNGIMMIITEYAQLMMGIISTFALVNPTENSEIFFQEYLGMSENSDVNWMAIQFTNRLLNRQLFYFFPLL